MIDWQMTPVTLLVAGAAAYILRSLFLTWKGFRGGCGSGCGSCGKDAFQNKGQERTRIPLEQVKLRTRQEFINR